VPEFLKQRQALYDALTQETAVIGTESDRADSVIREAMSGKQEYIRTTPKEAELVKFASNLFGATKISFANQFWRIAKGTEGADPDQTLEAFRSASPWVEQLGNGEDGLKGGWPYGGACLPKDSKGFMSWLMENDLYAPQISGTIEENQIVKNEDDTKDPQIPDS
jgi:UDPglucose 6-dehydrogenase